MNGVESNCEKVFCPKYRDSVDLKTCMLCPYYKKLLFKDRCCWKIEHAANFLKDRHTTLPHPEIP